MQAEASTLIALPAGKKVSAVVLSAGKGLRMGTSQPKQYRKVLGRPLICYTLDAFQMHPHVDEIILVTAPEYEDYCRTVILEQGNYTKVAAVVTGGAQRYDSVYCGLQKVTGDYVLIHDGARAFVTPEVIDRCIEGAASCRACVAGVPSKDTVVLLDDQGYIKESPERKCVWAAQTPQAFETNLVRKAYADFIRSHQSGVTDDAAVVMKMTGKRVKYVEGSYENIKVTTPEDLLLGEEILKARME